MANGEKPRVDIVNRPSSRHDAHSGQEWAGHIQLRENTDTRRDIRDARDRLGQFTVRFVTEAIYGDDYAREVFGEGGGHELIRDLVIDRRALGALANNVGGSRAQAVAERSGLNEAPPRQPQKAAEPVDTQGDAQVELLKALLKMMSPDIVKRALSGQ
jgi:hypothetical protein